MPSRAPCGALGLVHNVLGRPLEIYSRYSYFLRLKSRPKHPSARVCLSFPSAFSPGTEHKFYRIQIKYTSTDITRKLLPSAPELLPHTGLVLPTRQLARSARRARRARTPRPLSLRGTSQAVDLRSSVARCEPRVGRVVIGWVTSRVSKLNSAVGSVSGTLARVH